jgi:hypothetical protein
MLCEKPPDCHIMIDDDVENRRRISLILWRRFQRPCLYDWRRAPDGLGKYITKSLFLGWLEIRVWRT